MGLFDNLRAARDLAKAVHDSVPHWARIVRVGGRVGPMTAIDLELHHGNQPVEVVSTMSWVPGHITPVAGMDVAYRTMAGDDHTHYDIRWDEQPRYGGPNPLRPTPPAG